MLVIHEISLCDLQTPTTKVSPIKQAAMALSQFFIGAQKRGMPKGFGHCQQVNSKNPIRLTLVQKGEYWFSKGNPFSYTLRSNNDYISKVWLIIYARIQ
jgi:hypothetical protein